MDVCVTFIKEKFELLSQYMCFLEHYEYCETYLQAHLRKTAENDM